MNKFIVSLIVLFFAFTPFVHSQGISGRRSPYADYVFTETDNFNGILSADDDTVQKALDTFDDITLGVSELSNLSDVNTSTPTDKNVLVADGVDWESRALVETDISDLGNYLTDITGESLFDLSDIPADPNADKYLMWDDAPTGELVWGSPGGSGDMTKAVYDTNADDVVDTSATCTGNAATVTNGVYTGDAGTVFLAPNGDGASLTNVVHTESDPTALLTAGTDNVKDTHIDWGSGVGQVDTADITVATDKNFVTDAQLAVIGNTSGTNTGDNTVATSGDAAIDFFGAGVTAVTDATTCTDIEGTALSITAGTLNVTEVDPTVDTDDEIIAIINASPSTQIIHEAGGLEADVSAYNGLVKISGGATSAITDNSSTWDALVTESTTAGRSLTLSTYEVNADAELYTDTKCIWFENPVAADDFQSIWFTRIASTITYVWAESDQTVNLDLQVDDGTPADVIGTDIVADSTPGTACSAGCDQTISGDATLAVGDRLDLAITSVSGTPTWVSVCWAMTKDD